MRVLLLSDFYPPVVGGIERHVQSLGWELARRGHDVTVASIGHGSDYEMDHGVHVVRMRSTLGRFRDAYADASHPFAPPAPDPELTLGLNRLARELRPEVVHAHGWIVHSWIPTGALRKLPLVVTLHDYGLVCAKRNYLYMGRRTCSGPGLMKCLRCAAQHYGAARGVPVTLASFATAPIERRATRRFIAVSAAVARVNAILDAPHEVIPNFLPDEPEPDETRHADLLARLPSVPYLLFVGALGSHKGVHVLLRAYQSLAQPPPLVLIGHRWVDTPTSVPSGVVVLEDWPHEAVRLAWRRSILALIPSVWPEPFGIVAIEAMAAGVPVIASLTGGLPDVVEHGQTGLLVPPGDAAALAGAIRTLLADSRLRSRLGRASKRAAMAYRADNVVPRIEAVYGAALRPAAAHQPPGQS